MVNQQPSIEFLGILIHEPVNTLTDVMIAAVCLVAFMKLRSTPERSKIKTLFEYYFLSMSAATFIGGVVGHGLLHYLPFYVKLPGWITSMLSVALLERGVIQYARPLIKPGLGRFFAVLNILELFTFLVLSMVTLNFQFVLVHAAYGIAFVVGGFSGFVYLRTKSRASVWLLRGVLIAAIGAFFFEFKIGLDKWFNHVDISHVTMMIATICFYKGAIYTPIRFALNTSKQ